MPTSSASVRVYFARTDAPYRAYARLGRRREWLLGWALRQLTGRVLVHCAIGTKRMVLAGGMRGKGLYRRDQYECRYPGLAYAVEIPVAEAALDGAICRPSLGQVWCVGAVVRSLRTFGVPVPARVRTPAALYDWLWRSGYAVTALSPRQDGPCPAESAGGRP
jgi:hypothetical protein